MVVEGRGQTSVCEQSTCGNFSGLGHHRATMGSSPGRGTAKEAFATDNLIVLFLD